MTGKSPNGALTSGTSCVIEVGVPGVGVPERARCGGAGVVAELGFSLGNTATS